MATNFLKDKNAIDRVRRLAENNPSVADRMYNAVKDLKARVQSLGGRTYRDDATGMSFSYIELRNAERLYEVAMAQAARHSGDADAGSDTRYSIVNIKGNNGGYGEGVYLDTNIFNGVHPRNWNRILSKYVYDNLAGRDITVYDKARNAENISFAKKSERVTKDGASNSHKVIDKLSRTKGNANMLSIVHIDELLQTATDSGSVDEHSHQWLDQNGWKYKKAYVQDRNGNIYETTLNIAKTRDGRSILYSLSNTTKVDEGVVPSTRSGRGSHTNRQLSDDSITNPYDNVNPPTEKILPPNRATHCAKASPIKIRKRQRERQRSLSIRSSRTRRINRRRIPTPYLKKKRRSRRRTILT